MTRHPPPANCLKCGSATARLGRSLVSSCTPCALQYKVCNRGADCQLLQRLRDAAAPTGVVIDNPIMLYAVRGKIFDEPAGTFMIHEKLGRCAVCSKPPAPPAVVSAEAADAAQEDPPGAGQCLGHLLLREGECHSPAKKAGLCGKCGPVFLGQEKAAAKVLTWQLETAFLGTFCNPVWNAEVPVLKCVRLSGSCS